MKIQMGPKHGKLGFWRENSNQSKYQGGLQILFYQKMKLFEVEFWRKNPKYEKCQFHFKITVFSVKIDMGQSLK